MVTVLTRRDGSLENVGQVGNMGRGERIFAVRYVGDVAYVVTFRQTDPFYTVDLSDPTAPVVRGDSRSPATRATSTPLGRTGSWASARKPPRRGVQPAPRSRSSMFRISTILWTRLPGHQAVGTAVPSGTTMPSCGGRAALCCRLRTGGPMRAALSSSRWLRRDH
ncbi:MAG: hypothetical protein Ct9H300mP12_11050 [Acidimicrobiales bacterium]|nr:MAG: hypothetical protein Ct9H300mP12_11050 [Acidimicrobiales bacterium]